MRFLLKPSTASSIAANSSRVASASKAAAASAHNLDSAGKAWGQQCSPNCGCVLRVEAQLSECASSASPTIVQASYHAKRVMATSSHKICNNNNTHLKPVTTQKENARPILTSCTCPTLHHLAQQTVEHLPGKTLAQLRNEIDMGTVGARSSVAFRHTVLRENVIPSIESTKKQLGIAKIASLKDNKHLSDMEEDENGVQAMESTHQHGQCYDLVEDSLLSLIHERMPTPRRDSKAEAYSPTLGSRFRMYSASGRKESSIDADENQQNDEEEHELSSIHEATDWQRKSPSSFLLYGDETNGHSTPNSFNMTELLIQRLQESISDKLLGSGTKSPAATERSTDEYPPNTTYLQLLDMYGDEHVSTKEEEQAMEDWLEYVDQMHCQEDRPYTA